MLINSGHLHRIMHHHRALTRVIFLTVKEHKVYNCGNLSTYMRPLNLFTFLLELSSGVLYVISAAVLKPVPPSIESLVCIDAYKIKKV